MARHKNLNSRQLSSGQSRGRSAGKGWHVGSELRFRKLRLEALEDRRLLAHNIVIAIGGASSMPVAALTFSDNTDVTIDPIAFASATANIDLQANNAITFQDPISVHSGIALIAEANQSILVDNCVATTGANLTLNAGSGGISTAAAGEIASDSAVTLNTSGAIGSPSNPLQFDPTLTPATITVGSVTQPSATYLDGLGNLCLGSVNSLRSNGLLDVTARGNLTVLAGATLDTGTGVWRAGRERPSGAGRL
jgi:hypothetical protein